MTILDRWLGQFTRRSSSDLRTDLNPHYLNSDTFKFNYSPCTGAGMIPRPIFTRVFPSNVRPMRGQITSARSAINTTSVICYTADVLVNVVTNVLDPNSD